ncbi:unnamed protein product [Diamesa serratosioi]
MSSYRSHIAAPSRVFDHLYDSNYTTSDQKDIYKENCIALTRSAPILVYPVFRSMFSEANYEHRNCYAYQRNVLPTKCPEIGDISDNKQRLSVTGGDRTRFFSNPISNIKTINVGLMADESFESVDDNQTVKYKTTAIQTTFRESSAQTKPWLPKACLMDEHMDMPEVIFVTDLLESISYPGLREVEIIERARKRRNWELALPPIKIAEEIPTRVAAIEAFEFEEWMAREKDINECQQARLKLVADLIAKREKKHQLGTNVKLENSRKRIIDERKLKKDILIRNYQRNMRKLDLSQKKNGIIKVKKDDPVLAHYDRKMDYVLPKIRLDALSKRKNMIEYTNEFEDRFNSIEKENAALGDLQKYLKPKRDLWLPKEGCKEVEKGVWSETYLKKLHESLKQFRRKKYVKRKLPKYLIYDESAIRTERNNLPAPLNSTDKEFDKNYQNIIRVQKNIKGRAIQNMLNNGMRKYHDVIEEIKKTHSIAAVKKLFPKEFTEQIDNQELFLNQYKRIEDALKNDEKLQEELKKVESKDAGNLLSFLEKELQRLEGEKRAHALYLLAERERYSRQAISMGTTEYEEQFRNDAITLYLENILLDGVNRIADDESREYIRQVARKIDRKASKTVTFDEEKEYISKESNNVELKVESIPDQKVVIELLKENMVPKILDRIKNEQLVIQQRKYLMEAHQSLYSQEVEELTEDEEVKMCAEILDGIIEESTKNLEAFFKTDSPDSTDILAGRIVDSVINDIMSSNFDYSTTSTEQSSSSCYDGDESEKTTSFNSQSSTEILANKIVKNIINDVMEHFSSTSSEQYSSQESSQCSSSMK